MYITFCGMDFGGKQQYQDLSIAYLMQEHQISLEQLMVASDPSSTDLGKAIVPLDREKQHFNNTESGLLYIAASSNVYNQLIHSALLLKQHILCKGYFTEVLGYQGSTLGDQGMPWEVLKQTYDAILKTAHQSVHYPDLIFFCTSSFEQAQARALAYNSTSWEATMGREEYAHYSGKMHEAWRLISQDTDFTQRTKVLLVDDTHHRTDDVWKEKIQPEIDRLLGNNPKTPPLS